MSVITAPPMTWNSLLSSIRSPKPKIHSKSTSKPILFPSALVTSSGLSSNSEFLTHLRLNYYDTSQMFLLTHLFTHWKPVCAKVKPIWILMKQKTMGWQWHQLDHMQIICTSLQTANYNSTSSLKFFTSQMLFLMPNQQRQSTEGNTPILLYYDHYYYY